MLKNYFHLRLIPVPGGGYCCKNTHTYIFFDSKNRRVIIYIAVAFGLVPSHQLSQKHFTFFNVENRSHIYVPYILWQYPACPYKKNKSHNIYSTLEMIKHTRTFLSSGTTHQYISWCSIYILLFQTYTFVYALRSLLLIPIQTCVFLFCWERFEFDLLM